MNTRKRRVDYEALSDVQIPRLRRKKDRRAETDKLYTLEVIERDDANKKVKVHYVGYSKGCDEWRDVEDIVDLTVPTPKESIVSPFSLYRELCNKIKSSLICGRKQSPCIKIEMAFDKLQFDGGLRLRGFNYRCSHGTQRYKIKSYCDLNTLLGHNWHVRGINEAGDYCYVIKDTVEFYLYHRKPLKEFVPQDSNNHGPGTKYTERDLGYMLVFTFVRGDGTSEDFGSNPVVFCE